MKRMKLHPYYFSGHGTPVTPEEQRKTIGDKLGFSASEAYKLLRTNLVFSMSDEERCKVIGITSALRGEGKSTTAVNVAYSLAEMKKRVLLVEADMRIPVFAGLLKLPGSSGLSNVLAGVDVLGNALVPSGLQETMWILPAGAIPPNPAELLSSAKMRQIMTALTERFDYIIMDLPPITAVSDGLTISDMLSGMVVVVRKDHCEKHALAETMRQLEFLHVKVLGFVMNDKNAHSGRYRKYGRGRYYNYKYRYEKYGN